MNKFLGVTELQQYLQQKAREKLEKQELADNCTAAWNHYEAREKLKVEIHVD